MRILLLHNRYQQSGGEDMVVESERSLLESHGHAVELILADNEGIAGTIGLARAGMSAVYSLGSRHWIRSEIRHFQPDVVHVHNFFPLLSPSVYDACRAAGVPVVQTLHNYRLTCPNALLFRAGSICEDCLGKTMPWPGVVRGCYRGSRAQSAAVAMMIAAHRLRDTWRQRVDAFISLTAFQREVFVRAGLPPERLHLKPHFLFDPGAGAHAPGGYALFVGRLSEEKGLATLIEAYRAHGVQLPLRIVGDGPMRSLLEQRAEGLAQVTFWGRQERSQVLEHMRQACFLVFPSDCYETFGITIIEAFSLGLPVMAARLGGTPELLAGGERGWLVEPGDPAAWARALAEAAGDRGGLARRGEAARAAYEAHYTPEENYRLLMGIYRSALQAARSRVVRSRLEEQPAR